MNPDPFAALGLPARPDLSDEQVRAAWRSIAAATHPDRPDGGDLARYTAASAAYAQLRTPWARSEAYADLIERAEPERTLTSSGSLASPNFLCVSFSSRAKLLATSARSCFGYLRPCLKK